MFDIVYSIHVDVRTPPQSAFGTYHFRSKWLFLALLAIVAAGLPAPLSMLLLRA